MSDVNRVWFITGTSTGFGRALAEEVLAAGETVVATARQPEVLADLIKTASGRALALQLDVTEQSQIAAAVAAAIEKFGRIDVLVNNAGFGLVGAIEEVTDEQIQKQFATNVFGLLNATRAVLPHMRARRSGHIINLSSIGGLVGAPGLGIYNATKFAVEGITESLARELAPHNIKATAIEPGAFRTDFAGRSSLQKPASEAYKQTAGMIQGILAKANGNQPGDPRKVAQAIVKVVDEQRPPVHLLLGPDALQAFKAKSDAHRSEVAQWEALTLGTNFAG
jgi:NAD(P)-dependent dehydrogenase (short-subunit alcohol dehydrogenase family)